MPAMANGYSIEDPAAFEVAPPSEDLGALVALQRATGAEDWPRVMTTLDPHYWPSGGQAFWLHCTCAGRTVFAIGARLFRVTDLAADLEALELYYQDPPGPWSAERCKVSGVDLSGLQGTLSCDAALWVAPAFRGRQVSALAVWLCHAEAMARWDPDWYFGLTENAIVEAGVTAAQDYANALPLVTWTGNPYGVDFAMHACWSSRSDVRQGQMSPPRGYELVGV